MDWQSRLLFCFLLLPFLKRTGSARLRPLPPHQDHLVTLNHLRQLSNLWIGARQFPVHGFGSGSSRCWVTADRWRSDWPLAVVLHLASCGSARTTDYDPDQMLSTYCWMASWDRCPFWVTYSTRPGKPIRAMSICWKPIYSRPTRHSARIAGCCWGFWLCCCSRLLPSLPFSFGSFMSSVSGLQQLIRAAQPLVLISEP